MTEELDIFQDTTEEQQDLITAGLTDLAGGGDAGFLGLDELNEGKPPEVVQGEDGQMYRNNPELTSSGWVSNPDYSTPVYFFHQPLEAGDAREIYAEYSDDLLSASQQGYWRTEEEIKRFWEGKKTADHPGQLNMQTFREQHPNMSFETYMAFIKENSALHQQGYTLADNPEIFSAITDKYGVKTTFTNADGDIYGWNGSNYTKTYKVDDSFDVGGFLGTVVAAALTAGAAGFLAPTLAGALGSAGITISNTVAKGLITAALDLAQGNDIGLGTALSLVGADVLPGGTTLGEMVDNGDISQDVIDAIVGEITNPENYGSDDNGETVFGNANDPTAPADQQGVPSDEWYKDEDGIWRRRDTGEPFILPDLLPPYPYEDDDGGGAPEDGDPDADGDGVPASVDPDDNDPNNPNKGGNVENNTGEEITTEGDEVDGEGSDFGTEHNWKYLGDGCFIKIDEAGEEIPGTKICDPDYTSGDYEGYEVGGLYSAGEDPFGTSGGDEGETVEPEDNPEAGTVLSESCDGDDKYIVIADGEGGTTTEIEEGGCAKDPITLGGNPEWEEGDGGGDNGDDGDDGDAGDGGPKPGDACELSDGTEGTINEEGQCVKTEGGDSGGGITIGTNPEWGGEGDGNGDGNGDGGDDDGDEPPPIQFPDLSFGEFEDFQAGIDYNPILPPETPLPQAPDYVQSLDNLIRKLQSERKA